MRVVVVGGTGNIGTALLDALAADDDVHEIRVGARRTPVTTWPKTTFVDTDVTNDDLDELVAGADAVVDLVWIIQPSHRPTVTWNTNVVGSTRLFDAVARQRVPALVYSSSVAAYSPAYGAEVDESWPTDGLPTAGYGREKAYVERVLDALEASRPELRVVRMRPAFVFQRASGTAQLRLFGGPMVPASLLRPGLLPLLPFPAGLRLQAVHSTDVANAFHLALKNPDARGAYNLASDPVIDATKLAGLLGTRTLPVPPPLVRAALAVAWHARLVGAEPGLFDLAMGLPVMRTDRARSELGWAPTMESTAALAEALQGMYEGTGGPTPPLAEGSRTPRRSRSLS